MKNKFNYYEIVKVRSPKEELTEINGESVDNIDEDITTVGTLRSEERVTSQDDSSCPGTPLFTG